MTTYETKTETLKVGDLALVIRSLKDRQQFHDPDGLCEKAGVSPASWPLFGVMWPSAVILADLMMTWPLEDLRVLEIGCGLALGSLVAHHRGADVTASDYHPLAGSFLEENLSLNRFEPLPFEISNWSRANPALGLFDLIIGSDILYEPNHPELVSGFIGRHTKPDATIVIVDPGRREHRKFTRLMAERGYVVEVRQARAELAGEIGFKGKILCYTRAAEL
ncbi:MAG: methyltransferase domain-containing protein [Pseudomonadales bacterium]|nr:methyltransferase domain-containing protein [Pseudomonadales bacterium]